MAKTCCIFWRWPQKPRRNVKTAWTAFWSASCFTRPAPSSPRRTSPAATTTSWPRRPACASGTRWKRCTFWPAGGGKTGRYSAKRHRVHLGQRLAGQGVQAHQVGGGGPAAPRSGAAGGPAQVRQKLADAGPLPFGGVRTKVFGHAYEQNRLPLPGTGGQPAPPAGPHEPCTAGRACARRLCAGHRLSGFAGRPCWTS